MQGEREGAGGMGGGVEGGGFKCKCKFKFKGEERRGGWHRLCLFRMRELGHSQLGTTRTELRGRFKGGPAALLRKILAAGTGCR